MSKGILLFGHGARNPEYAEPFRRIKAAMASRAPQARIEIGFLELMQPTFEEAVDALVRQGVDDIRIVPIFFAPGKHVLKDLPERAAAVLDRYSDLTLDVADAVGMVPAVIDAMAEYALGN
jgi:sirohydrochlorin cobaltochelatase